jgi:hypothetical protein
MNGLPHINWLVGSGATCLGLVIGWLIKVFVERAPTFDLKSLATVASIAIGSAALAVFKPESGPVPDEFMLYFVGLFLTVLVLGLLEWDAKRRKITRRRGFFLGSGAAAGTGASSTAGNDGDGRDQAR